MKTIARCLLVLLALGCGKAGAPTPPVPQIPRAATDLVVAQQGPTLWLSWSFPTLTVAGTTLGGIERMRVYRVVEELPVTVVSGVRDRGEIPRPNRLEMFVRRPPLTDQMFRRLRIQIGELTADEIPAAISGARVVFRDNPPLQTTDSRPVRLHYAVVFETESEESAASNIATLVPLAVGLPPRSVTPEPLPLGVSLTWLPPERDIFGGTDPTIEGYNVYRFPADGAGAVGPLVLQAPLNDELLTDPEYLDVPPYGDYIYRVTAVAEMELQRSEGNPAAVTAVSFTDLTPPPAPQNVVTLTEDEAIRIVWDPVNATDLAGYRVYRETDRGRVSLQWEPIAETSFRDTRLEPAETYVYSVSSVDQKGNESERTAAAPVLSPR